MLFQRFVGYLCAGIVPAFISLSGIAQGNVNGIYRTETDFRSHAFSDSRLTDSKNYIQSYRAVLKIYRDGKMNRYRYGKVFGYYQNGTRYRAYRKGVILSEGCYCEVLKEGALSVYKNRSTHHRSNGYVVYYYSKGLSGTLRTFTKHNLKLDFSDEPDFLMEALAQYRKSDPQRLFIISDLYDSFISEGKKSVKP